MELVREPVGARLAGTVELYREEKDDGTYRRFYRYEGETIGVAEAFINEHGVWTVRALWVRGGKTNRFEWPMPSAEAAHQQVDAIGVGVELATGGTQYVPPAALGDGGG